MARFALIMNGDSEARHIENVERATARLKDAGYEVFVISTEPPSGVAGDHYWSASQANLALARARLAASLSKDDQLLLYTTGHGSAPNTLVFPESVVSSEQLATLIAGLPSRERTVVMDQCFSGNFAARFTTDAHTLFIASGSLDETTCCGTFAPYLWAPTSEIPDVNHDGVRSWQERFAYAASHTSGSAPRMLFGSFTYLDDGLEDCGVVGPAFENTVTEVHDNAALQTALARVGPGQVAVIDFSATWCDPCQAYKPTFIELARQAEGKVLFIRAESTDTEWMRPYGITQFPTVMLESGGYLQRVTDRNHPLQELAALVAPALASSDIPWILERVMTMPDDPLITYALRAHAEQYCPTIEDELIDNFWKEEGFLQKRIGNDLNESYFPRRYYREETAYALRQNSFCAGHGTLAAEGFSPLRRSIPTS